MNDAKQKRVAAVNDLSTYGRCALSIALPVLSAAGLETCAIPTALLSSHLGFPDPFYMDLTDQITAITNHLDQLNVGFDAIATGFFGSATQISQLFAFIRRHKEKNKELLVLVDPTMADNGKFYNSPIFTNEFLANMIELCRESHILMPNITEACLILDKPYQAGPYEKGYIEELLAGLLALGPKQIILTGVYFDNGEIGSAVLEEGTAATYLLSQRQPGKYVGTGDLFASTFLGAILKGRSPAHAAKIAGDFTSLCISRSNKVNTDNVMGVNFEQCLGALGDMLNN